MAEAQYIPANTDFAGTFLNTANAAQSFMARRQQMQNAAEDQSYRREQRKLAEPVYAAQREAQVATARATLDTYTQQQQLKQRLAVEAPVANAEYQAAMALPTFQEQQMALARIQPKYTWMGLIPEGKGFVDAVNSSRALAFQSAVADEKIKGTLTEIDARNNAIKEQIALRGQNDLAVAKQTGRGQTQVQRYMQARDDFLAAGDEEGAATMEAMIQKSQRTSTFSDSERITQLNQAADKAAAEGNPVLAKQLRDRIALITTRPTTDFGAALSGYLGGDPVAPTQTSPATPPVPVTPAAPSTDANLFQGITY